MCIRDREYCENRYADTEKSYEDWMRQLIQKSPYLGYFRSCTMIEEGVPRKMMDFSWSVPMGFSSDTLGSVHVLIGQEKASELLKTAYGQNHGYAYIATSDGKLVASSGMEEELWMVDLRSQESEGVEHREVRGVNSIISYTRSPRNGWQYVSVQPISDVLPVSYTHLDVYKRQHWYFRYHLGPDPAHGGESLEYHYIDQFLFRTSGGAGGIGGN